MLTPDLPTSWDSGSSPDASTDKMAGLIRHVLYASQNCAVAAANLSTAFGAEDAGPHTTLDSLLSNLQDPDMQNLSNYYDTFATIDSKNVTGNLLVFFEDTKKHCSLVCSSAYTIQPEPHNH